ncbi:MAG: ATP-binding protein [Eubacterium sp.]|nr:ATP-binding protein [Eubacterium sp.]
MNIKEAKQEIINTVKVYLDKDDAGNYRVPAVRQRPILLIGPPGVGKTQIMGQIADECGISLVSYTMTHHTRQTAVGLPFIKELEFDGQTYSVTEYTMSEIIASIHRAIESRLEKSTSDRNDTARDREGILFIDEVNCVSETLAPTMLQFLQNKKFGNQSVPEGWIIVAAGNPPEYNKSVREFDIVTLDRVRQIDVQADLGVWEEYASSVGIHRAIIAYLKIHPEHFYIMETDVSGKHFVTARGWEDFSYLLYSYREKKIPVTEAVIYEYLPHRDVAEGFSSYLELYARYEEEYPVTAILNGDVPSVIYERLLHAGFDERVAVVELILKAFLNIVKSLDENIDRIGGTPEVEVSSDKREESAETALKNAFSFMESAFGDGEEMVIFVTELTMNAECVLFLATHPSDEYLKYSEKLLIGTRRGELLSEIKRL